MTETSSWKCSNSFQMDSENQDVQNKCRACLSRSSLMYEIFDEIRELQSNSPYQKISDRIYYCTSVEMTENDGLPRKICQLCISLLNSAYEFKARVIKSDQELKQVKKEKEPKQQTEDHETFTFDILLQTPKEFVKDEKLISTEIDEVLTKDNILSDRDDYDVGFYAEEIKIEDCHELENSRSKTNEKRKKDYRHKSKIKPEKTDYKLSSNVIIIGSSSRKFKVKDKNGKIIKVLKKPKLEKTEKQDKNILEKLSSFNGLQIQKVSERKPKTNKPRNTRNQLKIKPIFKLTNSENEIPLKNIKLINTKKQNKMKERKKKLKVNKRVDIPSKVHSEDMGVHTRIPIPTTISEKSGSTLPGPSVRTDESFICQHCGQVLAGLGNLMVHVKTHFPPTHACDQCDYRASQASCLRRHKLKHIDIRNHLCQKCPKAFKSLAALHAHERIVHVEKEKNWQCDLCSKKYYTRPQLKMHIDTKHNDIETYKCEVCGKGFTERQIWRKHMFKHHNITVPHISSGKKKNIVIEDTELM